MEIQSQPSVRESRSWILSLFPQSKRGRIIFGSVGVLLLIAAVFVALRFGKEAPSLGRGDFFALKATIADAAGIDPATAFLLTSKEKLGKDQVQNFIRFTPEIEFSVDDSLGGTTFEIKPNAKLSENSVYQIVVEAGDIADRDYSWAFQVKAPFQILGTLPRNKGTSVPINTGIEMTFNRENVLNPEASFSVEPSVQGRFEIHRDVLVFVPSQPLQAETVYTATVRKGLRINGSDDELSEDYIFRFETEEKGAPSKPTYFSFSREFWEVPSDKEPAFEVYADNVPDNKVPIAIYQFDNVNDFVSGYTSTVDVDLNWTRFHARKINLPSSAKKILDITIPVENELGVTFVRIPQKLGQGWYFVDSIINGGHDLTWFQVTDIANYLSVSSTQTLVWLKNLQTKGAVSGASISFGGNEIGKTNQDGVALVSTPAELIGSASRYDSGKPFFFTVSSGSNHLAIPIQNYYGGFARVVKPDAWWKYLSLDKTIYLPTDGLQFWGVVRQRSGEDIRGREVIAQLTDPFDFSYSTVDPKDVVVFAETKATVSDFWTLTGKLSFQNLRPGLYHLTVRIGDEYVVSADVNIETYIKPAYRLILTSEKTALFAGDTNKFTVKAEFFDSTPVANLKIRYNAFLTGGGKEGEISQNSALTVNLLVSP